MNKPLIVLILLVGILLPLAVVITQRIALKQQIPVNTMQPTHTQKTPLAPVTILAKNLTVPWALAFLPDGSMLLTERKGTVRLITKDAKLQATPVATIADVVPSGSVSGLSNESGLMGITVSPDFSTNHFVYLFYTYILTGENSMNKIVRYRYENNSFSDEKTLLDGIPGSTRHDGGRLKFGPDGYLYATTGDALNPSHAQDKDSLAGKILRMTPDGKPVTSNPFYKEVSNPEKNEPRTYIYSFGHRNPQGITWDTTGHLWEVEHGESATDELNEIQPGGNYGWPVIRGTQKRAEMISPVLQSGSITWAPSDIAYNKNVLYFGGLKGQTLYQATVTGETATLKKYFAGSYGRIREVINGPDQMLYLLTSNRDGRGTPVRDDDKLIRINPAVFNE